jgi:hypothetical protein
VAVLWRHEQVLEALMEARAVLPVRFGTLLASRRELEEMLRQSYRAFVEDIARLRGHVEIGVRFLVVPGPEAARPPAQTLPGGCWASRLSAAGQPLQADAPGTAYLQTRLACEHRRRQQRRGALEMVRETCQALAAHASASKIDDGAGDARALSAAFLVHGDSLPFFRHQVARLAEAHPELALLCTGPWPAYSFVSAHSSQPAAGTARSHVH